MVGVALAQQAKWRSLPLVLFVVDLHISGVVRAVRDELLVVLRVQSFGKELPTIGQHFLGLNISLDFVDLRVQGHGGLCVPLANAIDEVPIVGTLARGVLGDPVLCVIESRC